VRTRIFLKIVAAAALIVAVATLVEIQQTNGTVLGALLVGSGVALLSAVILAGVIAQIMARRLRILMTFAEKLASGDLAARIEDAGADEVALLAAALDRTAARLERMFAAAENSRNQLETLLNSIEDAVIAVSPDGKVLWVNRSLGRVLAQVRVGESLAQVIRDPEVLHCVQTARLTRQSCNGRASVMTAGRVFQCAVAPLPDDGVVVVLHDVTEIERVERTRRDFIANVSHELRTPLTSIEGYTETLLESGAAHDAQTHDFLETIRRNASRMARLTEDLLKLARVESGEWRLERQAVPAAELLQDAVANLKSIAEGHEVTVEQSSAEQVLADSDAIHQVFANLIENAAKYSPAGTPIALGVHSRDEVLEFYVKDQGPGIAAEHVPRLFERFYRVDKARSREAGGTGLGLAIVKHIVMNHGGQVRVETEIGHGSTFFFSLPSVTATKLEPQPA
jgi:two-component system phosphate regulon sensor histidine kinase PhoR